MFLVLPTGGPNTPDWLTAWGTVGTAVIAVLAVGVTMFLAWRDRRRDERVRSEERAGHDRELAEEKDRHERERRDDLERYERGLAEERERSARDREDAERRLREEREHAEGLRLRERREVAATGLLGRIAGLMPFCDVLPGLDLVITAQVDQSPHGGPVMVTEGRVQKVLQAREAARALSYGGHAEVWGLGDERAAEQYRKLVHLVETAESGNVPQDLHTRAGQDLRRYALFVRVSLENLVSTGASLDPGVPPCPDLTRMPVHDSRPWQVSTPEASPTWLSAIHQEPGDPAYQPAR